MQMKVADRLVFHKIRARTGGRVRYFVSGGAPLSREIGEFFYAMGMLILEGYGLTETAPLLTINRPEDFKFGTVGKPVAETQIRIDPATGEILARGPQVMKGYLNEPEETAKVIDADGWFHTGDIGELDAIGRDHHHRSPEEHHRAGQRQERGAGADGDRARSPASTSPRR